MTHDDTLVWFRRDLRAYDHAALYAALSKSPRVHCVFVFDREILDPLPSRADRRVEFIWHSVRELQQALVTGGGGLVVLHGRAREEIPALAARLKVDAVFANHDYEPAALERDDAVSQALAAAGTAFITCKDQVIFEKSEILTLDGRPFSIFTAYKNAWLKRLDGFFLKAYPVEKYFDRLAVDAGPSMPTLADIGFEPTNLRELKITPGMAGASRLFAEFKKRMADYHERRDFPAVRGSSYLSVHLRFGTISIRALAAEAWHAANRGAAVWLSELIWRDFYFMILYHHPRVVSHAFRPEYDAIRFANNPDLFRAWCEARTGYPLIDAAMRQLNTSGYMHNRLRMVTASFLVKDLQVDWRKGERYFAEKLNDYDLAANNGGWQWAASTGCDAQPYFRIFNPVTQSEKFDAAGKFIRHYVPELANCDDKFIHAPWRMDTAQQAKAGVIIGRDYPAPAVDHAVARQVMLDLYARARDG
ncbi:MAG: Deoxyribodipyrimidine photo-lyase [Betaproteobacteria bacterium]|nr:Deoxyribodipyrimidine photo-lyase [Betaproteobacteria bacterium]